MPISNNSLIEEVPAFAGRALRAYVSLLEFECFQLFNKAHENAAGWTAQTAGQGWRELAFRLEGVEPESVKKAKGGLKHRLRLIFLITFCIKAKSNSPAEADKDGLVRRLLK